MDYILTDPNSDSGEVFYFDSLVSIKKHIEAAGNSPEECANFRIFKLEREIDVEHLFGPQKYD